jgi:hypothetical protein
VMGGASIALSGDRRLKHPPTRLGLHVHVVLLIHPQTIRGRSQADLCALVEQAIDKALGPAVNTIDVKAVPQFDPSQHIERLVGYSPALMMFRSLDEHLPPTDRWDIWPRRTGASTPASLIVVPRRRRPDTYNERLNLLRDFYADSAMSSNAALSLRTW